MGWKPAALDASKIPECKNDGDNFDKKIRSFVDAVEFGLPAPVPSSQIIYNQAIIDGIPRSAEAGKAVVLEIPEIWHKNAQKSI